MNGSQTRHWVRVARSFLVDGFILVFAFLAGTLIRLGPEWANDGFGFIQMLTLSVQQYWPGMLLGGLFFRLQFMFVAYMRLKVSIVVSCRGFFF